MVNTVSYLSVVIQLFVSNTSDSEAFSHDPVDEVYCISKPLHRRTLPLPPSASRVPRLHLGNSDLLREQFFFFYINIFMHKDLDLASRVSKFNFRVTQSVKVRVSITLVFFT